MKLPITLSAYIVKIFVFYLLMVIFCFVVLIAAIDSIEILRSLSGKEIGFLRIMELILLKFPVFLQEIMPFIVLVASVLTYAKLAKTNELVVVRSAGISAWEFLLPAIIASFVFGVVTITTLNPVATSMINRYEILKSKYFANSTNKIEISDSGFWLKQTEASLNNPDKTEEIIIHSKKNIKDDERLELIDVLVMNFNEEGKFFSRIDSDKAILQDGKWYIAKGIETDFDANIKEISDYYIPTKIKLDDLQKSLSEPQTISFWQLPSFIRKIQSNGFPPTPHILQFHKLLGMPMFFAAMVLIGAVFTLKSPRISRSGFSVAFSIIMGFIIYFASTLIFSIGRAGTIPIIFAAWLPILITTLIGIYMMLHLEDG